VLLVGNAAGGSTYGTGDFISFWSRSSYDSSVAWDRGLDRSSATVYRNYGRRYYLFSVRCKKN
jgi:hypothetical protein